MKKTPLIAITIRAGRLAACLTFGVAMLAQTARSTPNYPTAALSDNPLAFWQLNEASGSTTAADSSGNGLNATYGTTSSFGASAPQPPDYLGFPNGQTAITCAAADVNSPVSLPYLNLNTNAVTIAMWINPGGGAGTFTGLLMNRAGNDAAGFGFGGTQDANGMAELGYTWNTNSGSTWGFNSGLYPVAGIWQFVALVIQSNSATIYLYYTNSNTGQLVLSSAVNAIAHTPEAFALGGIFLGSDVNSGNVSAANNEFSGAIADAAVYTHALTSDQILALFAAGFGTAGFPPTITGQPQSQFVLSGASAQLKATGIGGSTPFSYQWTLNTTNVNLLPDAANFTGANSNVLTILSATSIDQGTYQLTINNSYGTAVSSNAVVTIQPKALVGHWFTNSTLADVSGYRPAGTHDGYDAAGTGNYMFTNDLPPGVTGQALYLYATNTGIAISNSAISDANYTNTFDNVINNSMTVGLWVKGWPTGWNPFVCKYGETTPMPSGGWQLRSDGNNGTSPCWTIRGAGGAITQGTAVYGNAEDMAATDYTFGNDGNWHLYIATFDAATGIRNIYVDGVLGAQETNNSVYSLAPWAHLCIGVRDTNGFDPGTYFGGEVYDVRVYNYALNQSDVLNWLGVVSPFISLQPQSTAVLAGRPAQFKVNVAGTPPLTYQWQLNGTNVNLLPDSANFTGINSNTLTVLSVSANDVGSYRVIVNSTLGYGSVTSSNASLGLIVPSLIGEWLNQVPASTNFVDVSGYSPVGTHDGYLVGAGNYTLSTDVPAYRSGYSITFPNADTGLAISNTAASVDAAYTNTFDGPISSAFSVACWAKGSFGLWGSWPAYVSKYGDNGAGWQIRGTAWGANACFCVRDNGAGSYVLGGYNQPGWDGIDDMCANAAIDNQWHLYVGTYDSYTTVRSLYSDGVLVAQETNNAAYGLAPNSHVCIGTEEGPTGTFGNYVQNTIKIYDVRAWNYALSASQVVALLNLPPGTPAQIGTQPPTAITTACQGITVQINAATGGSAPLTNLWQFNGTNLVDGPYLGAIIRGANTPSLTIMNVTTNNQGLYTLTVSNAFGGAVSGGTTLTVGSLPTEPLPKANLVGAWLNGKANLADNSGYSPAGKHDAWLQSGSTLWTNDVPGNAVGGYALYCNNAGLAISNSSTLDAGYTNTFDDTITNSFTVMCWAKGYPGGWNPWVSKYGENGAGWQLRVDGWDTSCFTIRGTGGTVDMGAPNSSDDGSWHHYAGTYDSVSGVRNLYVDGVLAATEGSQGYYVDSTRSHLMIAARDGGGNNFGNYYTGKIYDVRIYNTALDIGQVNSALAVAVPAFNGAPLLNGSKFVLSWDNGSLLQSTNVAGPWTPVIGATSPFTNDVTTASQMFYRLSNP